MRLADARRQPVEARLEPDAVARSRIADELGIPAVESLDFDARLIPEGSTDWRLEGRLRADVVQDCVVTLDPVRTRLDEEVRRRYVAAFDEPEAGEHEVGAEDLEALPATLDLFDVMVEALALALPPFPRAPGAELGELVVTEPGAEPLTDEAARPFAGLGKALKGEG